MSKKKAVSNQMEMFSEVSPETSNIPPKVRSYNEYGLIKGVNYVFNEDGEVDWKKMIPKKYFVINRQKEEEIQRLLGKPIEEVSLEELDEKYLLVLLGGFRYLANLRGFSKLKYDRPTIGPSGEVSVACTITWNANYETGDKEIEFTGLGDATQQNTSPINGIYYLTAIAENRAFIRNTRIFLKLEGIVGKDEIQSVKTFAPKIDESSNSAMGAKPIDSLISKCKQKGFTWMKLTEIAEQCKNEKGESTLSSDYTEWKTYKDIPAKDIYILLGKINSA